MILNMVYNKSGHPKVDSFPRRASVLFLLVVMPAALAVREAPVRLHSKLQIFNRRVPT